VLVFLASFVLVFVCLRFPFPLPLRILMVGLSLLVIRNLWRIPGRLEARRLCALGAQAEKAEKMERAIYCYEKAIEIIPENLSLIVRLLSAYNHTFRIVKAKELIAALDGRKVPASMKEELEFLVSEYRPIRFVGEGAWCRIELGAGRPTAR